MKVSPQLGGGFKYFLNFHPETLGEDFQFDEQIFSDGLVETTNLPIERSCATIRLDQKSLLGSAAEEATERFMAGIEPRFDLVLQEPLGKGRSLEFAATMCLCCSFKHMKIF